MSFTEDFAKSIARHKRIYQEVENIRTGWNNYNFLFYIGSVSAILGSIFGVAGVAGFLLTLFFFRQAGKFHEVWKASAPTHMV